MRKFLFLFLALFTFAALAQTPATPTATAPTPAKMFVAGGFSYAQYGTPGTSQSVFVGSLDYKLGGFLAFGYKFAPKWGMALVASASSDRLFIKDPYLDPAKAALESKGLSYKSLTLEGRYYFKSMYFAIGPTFTKFKMDGGPDNAKVGITAGIGGEFDLAKNFYIYTAASYTYLPRVEIIPGAPKNMSGMQSQLGLGFRF